MTNETTQKPRLQVIIVGAGLCGLSVGAGLREFADVTILESTAHLGEIGAAVHLAPNAHRILKAYGADLVGNGAMGNKGFQEWRAKDDKLLVDITIDPLVEHGVEWALCHRADLQAELLRLATDENGPGKPCKVLFSHSVVSADVDTATVVTKDGETFKGDVLVAADGIKSIIRKAVVGDSFASGPSGHSAYRGLLKAEKINADPELAKLGLLDNRLVMVNGGDRRLIMYPTRRGTLLNYVAPLPDSELNEISEEKWQARGDPAALIKSFASFPQRWQDLLALTDTCGLWQLRDQEPLNEWVKGRTIIVGDAAHAMLPHQGQGASQAIEDGEALCAFLRDVGPDGVHDALERVFRVRYKRATYIQEASREGGLGEMRTKYLMKHGGVGDAIDGPINPFKYQKFTWEYYGALDWEKNKPEWVLPVS